MKNKVKRLLSAVLALAMVISMLPGMRLDAFAEGDVCPECNGTGKQCERCGGTGICDVCDGTGLCDECEGSKEPVECYFCEGEGIVVCEECEGEDPDCSECGGEGEFECDYCKGTGSADCYFCKGTGACVYCEGSKECSYCVPCSTCNGTGKAELELPETLNDLEVTWPEGAHFGKGGIIQCVHDLTAVEGEYFHDNRNNRIYRVSSLTKGKYAVCAFGCEVILGEPFDDTAECLVCHHLASSHWSGGAPVDADNDRISYCKDCGDVYQTRCSGYTWAECLEGGNGAELPEKLNGFIATWPEGTYINGNGEIRCTHASPIFKDGRLISPGGSMAEFGLTAGAYTVCTAGCQVTLRDAPIPDTLNGYSVKWPENIRYDRGTATCPHGTTIFSDNTVHGVDNTWAVEELTENAYTVCERGCQILVGNVTPTDPLAGLKAMLEGKTEDACVTLFMNDVLYTGVAKVREQLNSIQNATGVKQDVGSNADWIIYTNTTGICFFHLADKHEETASGCKFCGYKYQCPHDNTEWDDGVRICRNCGDVLETCNHEGTHSGRCKNCGMIIGSTTTGPLAEIYAALKGKNDVDVCTGVDNYPGAMPVRGIDSVGWALSQMKNALSVSKTSPGYWTVIGPDYEYTVYVLDTHNFTDDTCVACGFRCTHNGAASGTCGICGVNLDALVTCEICGGSGELNRGCHRCRNTKVCIECDGTGLMPWGSDCYECGGTGKCQECINGFPCDYCNGKGMAPRIIWATGLTLDMTAITIKVGEMVSIPVTVTPDNATFKSVWWESSNREVADYNSIFTDEWHEGVEGFAPGTAILTAHRDNLTATCVVTVVADTPTVAVTGVTLDKTTASLNVGETLTLNAVVAPEGATNKNVSWASNNTGVAAVENGVVTAVAAGTATITVTTEDGSKTASCVVTIVNGDAQFAAEVDALIDAIGTVEYTTESKGKIEAARTAYDALTDAQKALVTKLNTLTAAETAYDNLKAESEAAAALAQAKADAKAAVEAAADGHTSANVVAAIDAAKAAIDAAASIDEVNTAKTKGVAAVNNVKHSYKENGKYSWANVDDNFAMSYEAVCEECHKVTIKQAAVEQEASEGYVTYTATTDEGKVYTKKVLATIVVTYNDEPYEYDYLEIVKLESDEKVDWYADGVLVSTAAKQYAFAATKNVTITTKEATAPKPVVTISANDRVWDTASSKYVFSFTTTWSVPEGYTFVKGGFIYRYGAANYGQIDRDTVFAKGTTVNSSLKVRYGTFDYTLKMSTSYATRNMFGIGFIVVKDQKGVEQTIYTEDMAINHAIG